MINVNDVEATGLQEPINVVVALLKFSVGLRKTMPKMEVIEVVYKQQYWQNVMGAEGGCRRLHAAADNAWQKPSCWLGVCHAMGGAFSTDASVGKSRQRMGASTSLK